MATLKQNSEALIAITDKLKSLPKKNELVELEVTENGEYTPPEGVDGFSKVSVNRKDKLMQYFDKTLVELSEDDAPVCNATQLMLFKEFPNLKRVVVPEGITTFPNEGFRNCPVLEEVIMPNTVTGYSSYLFYECPLLKKVTLSTNAKTISQQMFRKSGVETAILPNGITSIGQSAFQDCKSLKRVRIPSSVTSYGDYIFQDCTALTDVLLEDGLKKIGSAMFQNCSSLTLVQIPESVTTIGYQAFRSTSLTEVTLPSGLTSVGSDVFRETKLRTITFPDSVTSDIGGMAFYGCSELETVYLGNGIKYMSGGGPIGGPFEYCTKLYYIQLSNSCNTIPSYAFGYCTSLKTVTIPANVTRIQYRVFVGSGITTLTLLSDTPPELSTEVFLNCNDLEKIVVPIGSGDAYKAATNWSAYADKIVESEEAGGNVGTDNWLFEDMMLSTEGTTNLPAPELGKSYTAFVDGTEIATATCENENGMSFNTEDYSVYLMWLPDMGWHFHPVDSQTTSGSVSIRINN